MRQYQHFGLSHACQNACNRHREWLHSVFSSLFQFHFIFFPAFLLYLDSPLALLDLSISSRSFFSPSLCPISLRGSESGRQIQSLPGKSARRQWTNVGGTGERVWGIVRLGSAGRRGKKCFSIHAFLLSLLFGSLLFCVGLGATAFLAFKSQACRLLLLVWRDQSLMMFTDPWIVKGCKSLNVQIARSQFFKRFHNERKYVWVVKLWRRQEGRSSQLLSLARSLSHVIVAGRAG